MFHSIQFALKMIQKRPLRMSLALLQIAIGVASITLVLCFAFSMLYPDGTSVSNNLMRVEYGKEEKMQDGAIAYMAESAFSPDVVENVRKRATYLDGLSIMAYEYGSYIDYGGIRYRSNVIYGVDAGFAEMVHLDLIEGTFFSSADVHSRIPVAVISNEVSLQLFGEESGVGKTFVRSQEGGLSEEFRVIGVYRAEHNRQIGGLTEVHFMIPYSVLSRYAVIGRENSKQAFEWLLAAYKPGKRAEAKEELNQLFEHELRASGWKPQQEGLGLIVREDREDEQQVRRHLVKTFGLFLGSFAFVALVISSIGIVSIMLVSVVERTREIGLRRALGASRMSILGQILSESVFLAMGGGIIGLLIALAGIEPIINKLLIQGFFNSLMSISVHLSWRAVLVAMGSVVLVGLIAGLYPGIQASRLSPVEAVREG